MVRSRQPPVVLFAVFLVALSLAGCVGSDDTTPPADDNEPVADKDSGAVKGQVVTQDLDHVQGASVALVSDGKITAQTSTDGNGGYLFNGVTPGHYRVQVSSVCCKSGLGTAHVEPGSIVDVNFKLDLLTAADLQEAHKVSTEWAGFYSCGVSAGVSAAVCSMADETPAEDPNQEFLRQFNVSKGLKTLYVAMDWDPVGGVSGEEFLIEVGNDDCVFDSCSYEYAAPSGKPPLIIRIDNDDITDPAWEWDEIQSQRTLQYRVFPTSSAAGVVYQQPFTVYTHEFYWEEAPEDFNPLPDA